MSVILENAVYTKCQNRIRTIRRLTNFYYNIEIVFRCLFCCIFYYFILYINSCSTHACQFTLRYKLCATCTYCKLFVVPLPIIDIPLNLKKKKNIWTVMLPVIIINCERTKQQRFHRLTFIIIIQLVCRIAYTTLTDKNTRTSKKL